MNGKYEFVLMDKRTPKKDWWLHVNSIESLAEAFIRLSYPFRRDAIQAIAEGTNFAIKLQNYEKPEPEIVNYIKSDPYKMGLSIPKLITTTSVEEARVALRLLIQHGGFYINSKMVLRNGTNTTENAVNVVTFDDFAWPDYIKSDITIVPNEDCTVFWAYIGNTRVVGTDTNNFRIKSFKSEKDARKAAELYIVGDKERRNFT